MRFVRLLLFMVFVALPLVAVAQQPEMAEITTAVDWQQAMALLINSVLVVLAVQLLKPLLPSLPGGVKQTLALVAGPLLLAAQSALTTALGYPIDFEPLIVLLTGMGTGLAAMGLFDVGKRVGRKVVVARRE